MQGLEVERGGHHAVQVADDRQPPLEGQRADALGEHGAAHVVDDEVHAAGVGGLQHGLGEVAGPRAEADVESELLEPGQLLGGA